MLQESTFDSTLCEQLVDENALLSALIEKCLDHAFSRCALQLLGCILLNSRAASVYWLEELVSLLHDEAASVDASRLLWELCVAHQDFVLEPANETDTLAEVLCAMWSRTSDHMFVTVYGVCRLLSVHSTPIAHELVIRFRTEISLTLQCLFLVDVYFEKRSSSNVVAARLFNEAMKAIHIFMRHCDSDAQQCNLIDAARLLMDDEASSDSEQLSEPLLAKLGFIARHVTRDSIERHVGIAREQAELLLGMKE